MNEVDLSGLQVDVALRLFQTYFRMPVSTLPGPLSVPDAEMPSYSFSTSQIGFVDIQT